MNTVNIKNATAAHQHVPCNAGASRDHDSSWQPHRRLLAAGCSTSLLPALPVQRASCTWQRPRWLSFCGRRCRRHRSHRQHQRPGPASLAARRSLLRLPQLNPAKPHPGRQPQPPASTHLLSPSGQPPQGLLAPSRPRLLHSSLRPRHLAQARQQQQQQRPPPTRARRHLLQPSQRPKRPPNRCYHRRHRLPRNGSAAPGPLRHRHAAAQLPPLLAQQRHELPLPLLLSALRLHTACQRLQARFRQCWGRRRGPRRAPACTPLLQGAWWRWLCTAWWQQRTTSGGCQQQAHHTRSSWAAQVGATSAHGTHQQFSNRFENKQTTVALQAMRTRCTAAPTPTTWACLMTCLTRTTSTLHRPWASTRGGTPSPRLGHRQALFETGCNAAATLFINMWMWACCNATCSSLLTCQDL